MYVAYLDILHFVVSFKVYEKGSHWTLQKITNILQRNVCVIVTDTVYVILRWHIWSNLYSRHISKQWKGWNLQIWRLFLY